MDLSKNGNLLRDLRKAKGSTQKQIAENLGVQPKTVSKWETGHGFPDTSLLAEVTGVCESHAERMSDKAINIIKITMPFFIALFFKALYPSRYVAFTGAGTKTLAFLPITRTCHFCKQFAAFAKSRT